MIDSALKERISDRSVHEVQTPPRVDPFGPPKWRTFPALAPVEPQKTFDPQEDSDWLPIKFPKEQVFVTDSYGRIAITEAADRYFVPVSVQRGAAQSEANIRQAILNNNLPEANSSRGEIGIEIKHTGLIASAKNGLTEIVLAKLDRAGIDQFKKKRGVHFVTAGGLYQFRQENNALVDPLVYKVAETLHDAQNGSPHA
jgi:hypothetical protein